MSLLILVVVVVTLSVAVRFPSACEIQILDVRLSDLMVVIIGEERGEMRLIEVVSLNIHHQVSIVGASFSLKMTWDIRMALNEIIVGEKLIFIEWLMVLNFQDRWRGLEFFFFLH